MIVPITCNVPREGIKRMQNVSSEAKPAKAIVVQANGGAQEGKSAALQASSAAI